MVTRVAEAIRGGALPAIQSISMRGTPASEGAQQAVVSAIYWHRISGMVLGIV